MERESNGWRETLKLATDPIYSLRVRRRLLFVSFPDIFFDGEDYNTKGAEDALEYFDQIIANGFNLQADDEDVRWIVLSVYHSLVGELLIHEKFADRAGERPVTRRADLLFSDLANHFWQEQSPLVQLRIVDILFNYGGKSTTFDFFSKVKTDYSCEEPIDFGQIEYLASEYGCSGFPCSSIDSSYEDFGTYQDAIRSMAQQLIERDESRTIQ
jgi:hypothetical protein